MRDHDERLRNLEEQLEGMRGAGVKPQGAKPRLTSLPSRQLEDGRIAYRAEVFNSGKGIARDVRWCLVDKDGDMLTTVAGGDGVNLAHREHVDFEVTVLEGVEDRKWQVAHSRLTWRDGMGEHVVGRKPKPWPGATPPDTWKQQP
jgi:hypothetical protein